MYMTGRWEYDHKYLQWMIEWEQQSNTEAVGAIITNLHDLFDDDSSSGDESILVLQERAREGSSFSDGSTMSHLVPRGQDDSSSNGDTKSITEDGIYDN